MTKTYTRPARTKATALGERNRVRWSRKLRSKLFSLVPPIEFLAAEEGSIHKACGGNRTTRPSWTSTRVRVDQMATLELLQARHLKATGKEISRAEVLAALMASGLEAVLSLDEFSGIGPNDT